MKSTKLIPIIKSLAVESRLELFIYLNNCECNTDTQACMTDLAQQLNTSLPNIQRNIRELETAGLVEVNKVSRTCYFKVTKLGNKVFYLLNELNEK
jgi:predicted transcriptional regulator